jgi:leucyl/phenylalanyl-tRNA--protein transferase
MFSDMENGSKAALISLAQLLEENGYLMIDCQFHTDHLESMGGVRIGYDEYMRLLEKGLKVT